MQILHSLFKKIQTVYLVPNFILKNRMYFCEIAFDNDGNSLNVVLFCTNYFSSVNFILLYSQKVVPAFLWPLDGPNYCHNVHLPQLLTIQSVTFEVWPYLLDADPWPCAGNDKYLSPLIVLHEGAEYCNSTLRNHLYRNHRHIPPIFLCHKIYSA